jgi:hypothetical protein
VGGEEQEMRQAGGRADVHTYTWAIYACSVGRDISQAVQLLDDLAARVGMDDDDSPDVEGTTQEQSSSGGAVGGGVGVGTRRRRGGAGTRPPSPPPTRLYNTVLGMCGGGGGREAAAEAEVRGSHSHFSLRARRRRHCG